MTLKFLLSKCTGCRLCQLACSGYHDGVFNPLKARLKIIHEYTNEGINIKAKRCILCKKCEEICPEKAITNNGNWMIVDDNKCIGCGSCVNVCPSKVIYLNEDEIPMICDLCGGDPVCIQWCPKDVISLKFEVENEK